MDKNEQTKKNQAIHKNTTPYQNTENVGSGQAL